MLALAAMIFTLDVAEPAGLPRGTLRAELDVALRAWQRPACSSFRASMAMAEPLSPAVDGKNAVFWHGDVWPAGLAPNALAETVVTRSADGGIADADIHLNGVDYRWSVDGTPGTADLRGVLTHEIGHAIGLGHSNDPAATMFPSNAQGVSFRSLETSDVAALCALYPAEAGAPPTAGCEAGPPCPDGFVCIAHVCERRGEARSICSPCEREPGACAAAGDDARCIDISDGRVCGRACAGDVDCGPGFTCRETTVAGDRQCVSDDGCASGENPCGGDADCAVGACRHGACVMPASTRAATADAGEASRLESSGSGCSASRPGSSSGDFPIAPWLLTIASVCTLLHRSLRRREGRRRVLRGAE